MANKQTNKRKTAPTATDEHELTRVESFTEHGVVMAAKRRLTELLTREEDLA